MRNENIPVSKNITINPDSELIYASSVGVGADDDEVRLILFHKRLMSDNDKIEILNESDKQIILNRSAAFKLKELLE